MVRAKSLSIVIALATIGIGAHAAQVEANANATVQPAGVRAGSSGLAFFNVEGADNGSFASYGALRFDLSAIKTAFDTQYGVGGWAVDSVALQLTQSNASFTADGDVSVYFTANDTVALAPPSPLTYANFGSDFADAALLTNYTFTEVASGHLETHTLFDAPGTGSAAAALSADVMAGGVVTLLLREGTPGVAATYAGYTNFTYTGPTLWVDAVAAVPEPATYALWLCGVALVGARLRRRTGR